MIKKCLWVLSLIFFLNACNNGEDIPTPQPASESMTILSYLVANNNLDSDLLVNIGAMYDGLATMKTPATLLVYWDGKTSIGPNDSKHLILKYQTNGKGKINGNSALKTSATLEEILDEAIIVKEYPTQLSTDKGVMSQVLKDMTAQVTSDKIGLIVGSHASSWLNSIYTRAFGQDGAGDNTILISDMADVLKSIGKKFDFILFDACYMGTAEVAYTFRDVSNYQISSAMEVPAYGFPYESFMSHLYKGTISDYQEVCKAYINYYENVYSSGEYGWGTIALIDSKEVSNLTSMLKEEISAHKDQLANYDSDHLQEYGRDYGPYIAVDLEHFIEDLNNGSIPDAFSEQLDKTILYKGAMEKARPSNYGVDPVHFSGLGLYIPVINRPKWNEYFKTIDWYTASGWSEVDFSWDF